MLGKRNVQEFEWNVIVFEDPSTFKKSRESVADYYRQACLWSMNQELPKSTELPQKRVRFAAEPTVKVFQP